jgi:hypothetical protein
VLYLSTDYPLYLLSALLFLAILQPTIVMCAPLCLTMLCTTDYPLYSATEITGHLFGARGVVLICPDFSRRICSTPCAREEVAVGKRCVLHKAPHDRARCRLGVERNELVNVKLDLIREGRKALSRRLVAHSYHHPSTSRREVGECCPGKPSRV